MAVLIGERLRALREQAGLTQIELARRAGLNSSHISKIERSERTRISIKTAQRLAAGLGVDVECLLEDRPAPTEEGPAELLERAFTLIRRAAGRHVPVVKLEGGQGNPTSMLAPGWVGPRAFYIQVMDDYYLIDPDLKEVLGVPALYEAEGTRRLALPPGEGRFVGTAPLMIRRFLEAAP